MKYYYNCLIKITGLLCYLFFLLHENFTSQNTGTHYTFIILLHWAGSSEPQAVLRFSPIVSAFRTVPSYFRVNSTKYQKVSAIYWKY